MIVPMKKIYLIVQNKDELSALEKLRDLGSIRTLNNERARTLKTSWLSVTPCLVR